MATEHPSVPAPARRAASHSAAPGGAAEQIDGGLRLGFAQSPAAALGLAVSHLMGKPAYDRLKFSAWARVLAGQINRRHYCFVIAPGDRIVGMLGWALADRAAAERWAAGGDLGGVDGRSGDCVIFNVWSTDDPAARDLLLHAARQATLGCRAIYYRRLYANGRVRPVSLSVTDFIGRHADRKTRALRSLAAAAQACDGDETEG